MAASDDLLIPTARFNLEVHFIAPINGMTSYIIPDIADTKADQVIAQLRMIGLPLGGGVIILPSNLAAIQLLPVKREEIQEVLQ